MDKNTVIFSLSNNNEEILRNALLNVKEALIEKGYNPVNQIVGYILSNDPTYITTYKNARNIIGRFDRDDILEALVKYYYK